MSNGYRPVNVASEIHAELSILASQRSISLREIVESALMAHYPELAAVRVKQAAAVLEGNLDGGGQKRRGRPPGSVNKKQGSAAAPRSLNSDVPPAPRASTPRKTPMVISEPAAAPAIAQSQVRIPDEHDDFLMAEIVNAVLLEPDPLEQIKRVETLQGSVKGSFGQALSLKDLAYHLRSSDNPITTLQELIEDYEKGA